MAKEGAGHEDAGVSLMPLSALLIGVLFVVQGRCYAAARTMISHFVRSLRSLSPAAADLILVRPFDH
jgi:hypothetical protein